MTDDERYVLGLLAEECGEVVQACGKALRFGLDSPAGPGGATARQELERELGDVRAAVEFARRPRLLDPNAMDRLGRRLATAPSTSPVHTVGQEDDGDPE